MRSLKKQLGVLVTLTIVVTLLISGIILFPGLRNLLFPDRSGLNFEVYDSFSHFIQLAFLFFIVIIILTGCISLVLLIKYLRLDKKSRAKLLFSPVLPYLIMIFLLFIFSITSPLLLYLATKSVQVSSPGLPQVCLSAGESVACKSYYDNGINDPVVQWCEAYYVVATQASLDPLDKNNTVQIAQKAASDQTGYAIPKSAKGISSGGAKYTEDVNQAGFLCINPTRGGFMPI